MMTITHVFEGNLFNVKLELDDTDNMGDLLENERRRYFIDHITDGNAFALYFVAAGSIFLGVITTIAFYKSAESSTEKLFYIISCMILCGMGVFLTIWSFLHSFVAAIKNVNVNNIDGVAEAKALTEYFMMADKNKPIKFEYFNKHIYLEFFNAEGVYFEKKICVLGKVQYLWDLDDVIIYGGINNHFDNPEEYRYELSLSIPYKYHDEDILESKSMKMLSVH